ncbi:phosphotriesterase family protein [Deinococcus sp.]|uniref:phosphotriesterase family protein n=1 Tax=Deinococcus sp. TaxID=47478 RepID=UPI003CC66184
MSGLIVRTVRGDLNPALLGLTLSHEHLYAVPPPDASEPDLMIDDLGVMARELTLFRAAGGGTVVEMTTPDYGRDGRRLLELSRRSGVHIVAATGYNKARFAERLTAGRSVQELSAHFVREVTQGLSECAGQTPSVRAGVIKASSSLNGPSAAEQAVFMAAAAAHRVTHAPISTHTEKGTWAQGQLDLLSTQGVPPARVLVGHLDLNPDLPALLEVAARGAYLGLDQFGKAKYLPDARRAELVCELFSAGYGAQVLLSGDMARRSSFAGWGGPGLTHLPGEGRRLLRALGLSDEQVAQLLIDNPRRFFSFSPGGGS